MSAVIIGVFDLTIGLFWDKVRDHTAERLQDGDVTEEKCRQIIVRELDNMRSILEGLSRKDLLASVSFVKEGVCLMSMAFGTEPTDKNNAYKPASHRDKSGSCKHSSSEMDDISTTSSCESQVKGKKDFHEQERFEDNIKPLAQILKNFDVVSNDRLSSARNSFADARREATRAFNNKALAIKDRILASKLRVISRMLENLEDPWAVVDTCMLYLEELHNLEGIQALFNVHIKGGLKSLFNKQKRQELMSSVLMINYVLANFTLTFATEKYNVINWPKIEITRGSFNPLLDSAASAIMRSAKIGAPHVVDFTRMKLAEVKQSEFAEMTTGSGHIAEIVIRGGVMSLHLFHNTDEITNENAKILLFITDDGLDNIYVIAYVQVSAHEFDFLFLVADNALNITFESKLVFLADAEKKYRLNASIEEMEFHSNSPTHVEFSLNTAVEVLVFGHQTFIYICDTRGQLSHNFKTSDRNDLVCLTDSGDIITAAYHGNSVYAYSLDGSLTHQFDIVRGRLICDVVLHHTSHMIYALTRNFQNGEFQLEIYTQRGENRGSLELLHLNFSALFALLEGPVAVFYNRGFILI